MPGLNTRPRLSLIIALTAAMAACTTEPTPADTDASTSADAGPTPPADTGPAPDAGQIPDAGEEPDADTPPDTGVTDGGPEPDGGPDAGPVDTGPADSGPADTGPADGGADAGPPDAGNLAIAPSLTSVVLGEDAVLALSNRGGATATWAVEGIVGGSDQVGRIQPLGSDMAVYRGPTAPLATPTTFTVTATIPGDRAVARVMTEYPVPTLVEINPPSANAGTATPITATITGTGFVPGTLVLFGGVAITITSVTWTQIVVEIPPNRLANSGQQEVAVLNPAPGGGRATTGFFVLIREVEIGNGLPANIPSLFDGAMTGTNPALAPAITYPENGAVAPRNFPAIEVAWTQAADANVCRLDFSAPSASVQVYAPTGPNDLGPTENPFGVIEGNAWPDFVLAAQGPIDVTLSVACGRLTTVGGAQTLAANTINVSTPVVMRVSDRSAGGRIVYFSGINSGLHRIEVGSFAVIQEGWVGPGGFFQLSTTECVGCHSFSQNGRRMSYVNNDGAWGVLNISGSQPTPLLAQGRDGTADWGALHPNDPYILAVDGAGRLNLRETNTGRLLGPVPMPGVPAIRTQAAWSPTGDQFAFVASSTVGEQDVISVEEGQIYTMTFSTATSTIMPTFTAPRLAATGTTALGGAYYPSYSPDGQWIVFCRAPSGESYDNPGATLYLMSTDGTVGPIELANANRGANLSNSWPRWAPQVSGTRYWLVFSSQRPYPVFDGGGPQQLWISEVDVGLIPGDPSSPAVWLPGQEPFTGNLTAEWSSIQ